MCHEKQTQPPSIVLSPFTNLSFLPFLLLSSVPDRHVHAFTARGFKLAEVFSKQKQNKAPLKRQGTLFSVSTEIMKIKNTATLKIA